MIFFLYSWWNVNISWCFNAVAFPFSTTNFSSNKLQFWFLYRKHGIVTLFVFFFLFRTNFWPAFLLQTKLMLDSISDLQNKVILMYIKDYKWTDGFTTFRAFNQLKYFTISPNLYRLLVVLIMVVNESNVSELGTNQLGSSVTKSRTNEFKFVD